MKDEEIIKLQVTIQHLSKRKPCVSEFLRIENVELKKIVSTLTEEVLNLNVEIRNITKELLHFHATENNNMALLVQTLFLNPLLLIFLYSYGFFYGTCK